jgi:hypothetical protein
LNGFGIPEPVTAPLAFLLAAAEILTGILLLPAATAAQGAAAALTLSAIFAAAVLVALARGKRPDCHCFGNFHSKPISKSTLARIGALAATAAYVAWAATKSNPEPLLTSLPPSTIALLALTTVLAAALIAASAAYARLLKKYGGALVELEAAKAATPAATRPAPDFSLPTISGTTTTLASLLANRRPLLLVSGCR